MKVAWLLPGQGMEEPRMGIAATAIGRGRELLERASSATGVELARVLVEGGASLARTEVLQPLLAAVCLSLVEAMRAARVPCDFVAGHSSGGVPAWAAAGGITIEQAIDLAVTRGRLMAREAARVDGGMLALVDADESDAERALGVGRRHGCIDLAAINAPRQCVLSGEVTALAAVARTTATRGLAVAGPWHSQLMRGAHAELVSATRAPDRRPLTAALVDGATGDVMADSDDVGACIAAQLVHPVAWKRVLQTLASRGVTDYVTVGPGRVLRSFVRLTLGPHARIHDASDLDGVRSLSLRLERAA